MIREMGSERDERPRRSEKEEELIMAAWRPRLVRAVASRRLRPSGHLGRVESMI
jgi:hypothetical protein